jgi:hypothetical protein
MALSHECECIFDGHIVVLQAAYINRLQGIALRLYVNSVCVDQRTVSTYDMARHTLRGRLRVSPTRQVAVTGTLTLGWLKKPHYGLYVNHEMIHEEHGPWHSL